MCGILGIISTEQLNIEDRNHLEKMSRLQYHRGPDDYGFYESPFCYLIHRRLSILDLSPKGHQPMVDPTGRYVITYNGEVYNYLELRKELEQEGMTFQSQTDTEVVLAMFVKYGEACLKKFNGMFAFAILDTHKNELFLGRDRFGIKPLYYFHKNERFYFSSEVKSIIKILKEKWSLNRQTIFDYFVFNRTDVFDETFLNEVKKIPKGHFAWIRQGKLEIKEWWNAMNYVNHQRSNKSYDDEIQSLQHLFLDSAKIRMRSDVPVGSCLSGGLDSSIIVGALRSEGMVTERFKTFSAVFPGFHLDESSYIDLLSKEFEIENHQITPTLRTIKEDLDHFVLHGDEPMTGASFYTQYCVMRLAKKKGVIVLLDGQGGDENFAGYQYFHGFHLYELLKRKEYKAFFRKYFDCMVRCQHGDAYKTFIFQTLPSFLKKKLLIRRSPFMNKRFLRDHFNQSRIFKEFFNAPDLNTSLARHFQYKLEHLLRSEDRNSMAFSIECRVPYLDYRLVEKLLSIPSDLKIKDGETKFLQKKMLGEFTLPKIRNRTDKIGFATPMEKWLNDQHFTILAHRGWEYLNSEYPEIFNKSFDPFHGDLSFRWKLIHLMKWHELVLS